MKKGFLAVFMILAAFFAVGCAQDDEKGDISVALVMSGAKNDGGWNETAYNGLVQMKEKLGAKTTYIENVKPTSYEQAIRNYAKDGNDVVIAHGAEFGDAIKAVAEEYPDIQFIVTSTNITNGKNLSSLNNNYRQAGFLQGAFAAMMSKSGVVGGIGGMAIPPIANDLAGFEAGAKYVKPSIKVLTAMTGNFDDANAVKEQAIAYISQGADMIMVDADHAGVGGYVAAEEKGIYAIASIAAEYDSYQKSLIACATADMSTAIYTAVKRIADDDFKVGYQLMGLEDDIVGFTYSKYLKDKVPKDVLDEMDQIADDLVSGKIDLDKLVPEK